MKKKIRYQVGFVFFLCAVTCSSLSLFAFIAPSNSSGYVNDFAHVLSMEHKNTLEKKLELFNASTTNEIAIVTVPDLGGDYIEHYASELFKSWGIGTKKNNNGVLLLVAVNDRKMRIEVGYGLEGALTDAGASQIIRNDLVTSFKQNDFYGGIDKATDDIIKATKGEYIVSTPILLPKSKENVAKIIPDVPDLILVTGILFQLFASILARSKSWWAGGVVGGIFGALITFFGLFGETLFIGVIATIFLIIFGFFVDYIVSNRYKSAVSTGSRIPWWVGGRGFGGGGFSSGGGSSSGGFGGFSGGGSGGGGASGSW